MGFFDRQKAKTRRWMREALEGRLEPGENVVTGFLAMNRVPWWRLILLMPLFMYLEVAHGFELPSWFTGVLVGGLLVIFVRYHFVVLTDRRLLVLHLAGTSQRRVASEEAFSRQDASAELGERMINGRLRLTAGGARHDLAVGRPHLPEARQLVDALKGSPEAY